MSAGIRRGVSGMYIFDTFPTDTMRIPTCFEDCLPETQEKWLNSLEPEAVKEVALHMARTLKTVCEDFDIQTND
jgi:hypothetical protein